MGRKIEVFDGSEKSSVRKIEVFDGDEPLKKSETFDEGNSETVRDVKIQIQDLTPEKFLIDVTVVQLLHLAPEEKKKIKNKVSRRGKVTKITPFVKGVRRVSLRSRVLAWGFLGCVTVLFASAAVMMLMRKNVVDETRDKMGVFEVEDVSGRDINSEEWVAQLKEFYEENSDTVAVLYVPGTHILYPVMHTPTDGPNENYYLRRGFDKKYLEAGTLFVDKNNSWSVTDFSERDGNTIIYGHNMNSTTMFSDLMGYESEEFYREHQTVYLYTFTIDGEDFKPRREKYEVIASFKSRVYKKSQTDVFKYYQFLWRAFGF